MVEAQAMSMYSSPVEFETVCPDCNHLVWAVAYPGQPYEWDIECDCQRRRQRKR